MPAIAPDGEFRAALRRSFLRVIVWAPREVVRHGGEIEGQVDVADDGRLQDVGGRHEHRSLFAAAPYFLLIVQDVMRQQ